MIREFIAQDTADSYLATPPRYNFAKVIIVSLKLPTYIGGILLHQYYVP